MANARPKINIPLKPVEIMLYALGVLALAFTVFELCTGYAKLPDTVATHFNFAGEADGWGSKTTYLWINIVGIVCYIGMIVLSFFPNCFNFPCEVTEENAGRLYYLGRLWMNVMALELIWLFALMFWCSIRDAAGLLPHLTMPVVIGMCVLITVSCIVMIVTLNKAGKEPEY